MINRENQSHFICVVRKKKNIKRYVTVVSGIPFYQSTGSNSKEKGTWFPFMGLQEEDLKVTYIYKGLFLKPTSAPTKHYFPKSLADYLLQHSEAITDSLLDRLGNFQTMCVSMLIGGGFWEKDSGKELKNFIIDHYANEVEQLSSALQHTINEIQQMNNRNKKIAEFDNDHPAAINAWLKEHGSIGKQGEYGISIDFQYSDFRHVLEETRNRVSIAKTNMDDAAGLMIAINNAKKDIQDSFQFYRPVAKQQKLAVLTAAEQYLQGQIDKAALEGIIQNNPQYADAFLKSGTKSLIDKVLVAEPNDQLIQIKQNKPRS